MRLHLIEKRTEADIPKETATELLEFVEQKQTNLVTKVRSYLLAYLGVRAFVSA